MGKRSSMAFGTILVLFVSVGWYGMESRNIALGLASSHVALMSAIALMATPLWASRLHDRLVPPLRRRMLLVNLIAAATVWGAYCMFTLDFVWGQPAAAVAPLATPHADRTRPLPPTPAAPGTGRDAPDLSRYAVPEERPARDD